MRSVVKRLLLGLPGGPRMLERARRIRGRLLAWARSPEPDCAAPARESLRLVVVLPEFDAELAKELRSLSPRIAVVPVSELSLEDADYVYAPETREGLLSANQLLNALLCVADRRYDFALVSSDLEEPGALWISTPFDNAILSRTAYASVSEWRALPAGARGRLLRIVPAAEPSVQRRLASPGELGWGAIAHRDAELWVHGSGTNRPDPPLARGLATPIAGLPSDRRPLVLVISIFMAVGGVERNLIEVMRRLADRYRFVVVTSERVSAERGSLNHQCAPHCHALFDLAELAPQSRHLQLLDLIARSYTPDLLFICNGSPWLLRSSSALRSRFRDIPIVDQQVYDVVEGWIEHYGDPGIQSFDRFVAINRGIRSVFLERFAMRPEQIDLIYHAIDDDRFNLQVADRASTGPESDPLGLRSDELLFIQVGRLVDQKRPLDFLELAARARDLGLDDRFLLVGDGELAARCDAIIAEQELGHVRRIPYCDDMAQILPHVDGMLVTSQYEGLPVVVLEALAMGVPVLSTDVGEIRSVVEEYGSGTIVETIGKSEDLLRVFLSWRSELRLLRARARAAAPEISRRFSATAVADDYHRCWQTALEAPSNA